MRHGTRGKDLSVKTTSRWALLAGALVALALVAGCSEQPEGDSASAGGNTAGMSSGGENGAGANTADGSGAAADGAALYARSCQGCHGENGAGVEGSGPELTHAATMDPDKIHEIIENGSDDKKMPPFKDQLSDAEITAVIDHLKTFGGEGAAAGGGAHGADDGHGHGPGDGHNH